jgi:hypothetical protein
MSMKGTLLADYDFAMTGLGRSSTFFVIDQARAAGDFLRNF